MGGGGTKTRDSKRLETYWRGTVTWMVFVALCFACTLFWDHANTFLKCLTGGKWPKAKDIQKFNYTR